VRFFVMESRFAEDRISAADKLRDVLEQAKQREKPVDKMSKTNADAVAVAA
jgi:hypothetical protein